MADLDGLTLNIRAELIEPTPGFWSPVEIKKWINEAYRELVLAAKLEATPATLVTVAGTELYALAADFGEIIMIERLLDNNRYVPLLPLSSSFRLVDQSRPVGYSIYAGQLQLTPVPDDVYTLRYRYYKVGVDLVAGSDVPVLDSMYHKLIEWYAVAKAKQKADDSAYRVYLDDYNEGRQKMLTTLKDQRQGPRFSQIRDVDAEMDSQ